MRSGCDDTQAFELRRWLEQEGLPPSKMPDEFVFGPALPKTGAGKIDPLVAMLNCATIMANNPAPVRVPEYNILFS